MAHRYVHGRPRVSNNPPPVAHIITTEADWLAHLPLKGWLTACGPSEVFRTKEPPTTRPAHRVCQACLRAVGDLPPRVRR